MEFNLADFQELQYFSTLKKTSVSESDNTYMTDSEMEVIDFDKVKERYVDRVHPNLRPKSNDALLQCGERIFFIEFKDGNMKEEIYEVQWKMLESLLLYCDITKQSISDTRKFMVYILVYNHKKSESYIDKVLSKHMVQDSENYNEMLRHMGKLSKSYPDVFGLKRRFARMYFSDVWTIRKEDFSEHIFE